MTGSRYRLQVFELPDRSGDQLQISASEMEEARLAAFEKGYKAGWDDAVAAQATEAARQKADMARALQDLAFTYHEAHGHVLRAMEPLLQDMVTKVLPLVARKALGQVALEALRPLAEEMAGAPVTVMVNPANRAVVEALLTEAGSLPLRCVEEPSLGDGQVYLRMGDSETRVDLDGVIAAIGTALTAFFASQKENADG